MIRNEDDASMRSISRQNCTNMQAEQEKLVEHDLRLMPLPPDPYADLNIFMDIRAGAGEEAA